MSDTTTTPMQVATRISNVYQMEAYYLSGTTAATAVSTYLAVADPTKDDLNALRASLYSYLTTLPDAKLAQYVAVNRLLQPIEISFLFEKDGASSLSSNFASEHVNGLSYAIINQAIISAIAGQTTISGYAAAIANTIGNPSSSSTTTLISALTADMTAGTIASDSGVAAAVKTLTTTLNALIAPTAANLASTIIDGVAIVNGNKNADRTTLQADLLNYFSSDLVVTATSAIGPNDISAISSADDNTITGIMGSTPLTGVSVLGVVTPVAATLSASIANNDAAFATAIGNSTMPTSITILGVTTSIPTSLSGAVVALSSVISTAVGTTPLPNINVLGSNITAPTSLSGDLSAISVGLASAIGNITIAPTTAKTVSSCTYIKNKYAIEKTIYTTANTIADTIHGITACGKWADNSATTLYFSPTGLVGDCGSALNNGQALAKCLHYLDPTP